MNYTIFIISIGLLLVCGCIADGHENMFNRDSSSRWYKEADAYENNMSGFTLQLKAISLIEELVLKRQSDELERQAKALPKKIGECVHLVAENSKYWRGVN